MLGSGGMARTYLEAFACVRDIQACRVYSPSAKNRERFAEEMSRKLKIPVTAVESAQAAVKGADIVSSCTDAMIPVYDGAWLEPGQHVTNLGFHEVPDSALERADVFIRQGSVGLELAPTARTAAGIGHSPSAFIGGTAEQMKRLPRKSSSKGTLGDSAGSTSGAGGGEPDFADLVEGKCAGRTSRDQVTFYRNQGNQGLQFSSVGGWVYAQAVRAKQGREIPTEWFLQNIRD
jgi:alanine dehydrogenase